MFYLIGLGLVDPIDISVKGLEIVKRCSRVYLESYTIILFLDRSPPSEISRNTEICFTQQDEA
uniref:Diphthine methyl ester synthase n=1 Tax=Glossina morsitans morsitans TaxID=37546 RepID=A0A1B0G776_GLOMM